MRGDRPLPAGEQVQRILATCGEAGLRIGAIVATHDHPDHIEGIPELVAATGAPVYAPRTSRINQLLQKLRLREVRRREACMLGGCRGRRCGRSWSCRRIGFGGLPHSCEKKAGWSADVQALPKGGIPPL